MAGKIESILNWGKIELFAMDVDGILTDGSLFVSSDGSESKRFSIIDGMGLALLRESGVKIAWISGRGSEATQRRADELKIPYVVQGELDKVTALRALTEELELSFHEQSAHAGTSTTGDHFGNAVGGSVRSTYQSGDT